MELLRPSPLHTSRHVAECVTSCWYLTHSEVHVVSLAQSPEPVQRAALIVALQTLNETCSHRRGTVSRLLQGGSRGEELGLTLIQGVGQELVPEGLVQAAVRPTGAEEHSSLKVLTQRSYFDCLLRSVTFTLPSTSPRHHPFLLGRNASISLKAFGRVFIFSLISSSASASSSEAPRLHLTRDNMPVESVRLLQEENSRTTDTTSGGADALLTEHAEGFLR
ncbi:hypothetical protein EYF80_056662 [Liparis tanakae]|uniref:Uncharacterized protein n=1 Tax=Liparis tanakae TaxID=230148 RepID=A0A4Z2EWL5_9TELE|nr:hypothetical protein EYF80_056662 [Liparis tanakae]